MYRKIFQLIALLGALWPADAPKVFLPILTSYIPPQPDYYIAFVSDRDGSRDIYTMRPDGSNLLQVTNDDAFESFLSWSPDAKKIVYTVLQNGSYDNDLYIVDATGGVPEPLTDNTIDESSPDWSPDGTTIAYSAYSAGTISIFLIGADGSNKRRLTPDSFNATDPRWSPDGEWIVFEMNNSILAITADGQYLARLTSGEYFRRSPIWAPDWSRVAYVEDLWSSQQYCIGSVLLDNLERFPIYCQSDSIDALDWSPDGTRILYTRYAADLDMFVLEVNGHGLTQLTDSTHTGGLGRWSPVKLP